MLKFGYPILLIPAMLAATAAFGANIQVVPGREIPGYGFFNERAFVDGSGNPVAEEIARDRHFTFDFVPLGICNSSSALLSLSGGGEVRGSVPNRYLAMGGRPDLGRNGATNTSCYHGVSGDDVFFGGFGQSNVDFRRNLIGGGPNFDRVTRFSFFWGSIDEYQSVAAVVETGVVGVNAQLDFTYASTGAPLDNNPTGEALAAAAGIPLYSDAYVEVEFAPDEDPFQFLFVTGNWNFEIDNLYTERASPPAIGVAGASIAAVGEAPTRLALAVAISALWLTRASSRSTRVVK